MDTLGAPPVRREIPVTKGCDFTFTIALTDPASGDPVSYTGAVAMNIDLPTPQTVAATIDGNIATIVLTSDICDQTGCTTRWRVINTVDGTSTPLAVGVFQRYD